MSINIYKDRLCCTQLIDRHNKTQVRGTLQRTVFGILNRYRCQGESIYLSLIFHEM